MPAPPSHPVHIVRPAEPGDAPALAEIQIASYRSAYADIFPQSYLDHFSLEEQTADWRELISAGERAGILLVAEDESGAVAGYALARPASALPTYDSELVSLHVRRSCQGQGFGKALIFDAARRLQQAGCASMMLWVLEQNSPSRRLYEHLGGRLIGWHTINLGEDGEISADEVAYGWPTINGLLEQHPAEVQPVRGIIFDIDGVLTFQGQVYPGAVDAINFLRQHNISLRFLTNSTLKSRASAAEKLRLKGFDIRDGEVLTASSLSAVYLRSLNPRSAWIMVEREGADEFRDFINDEQNPEYIVIGDNRSRFDFDHLNHALRLLKKGAKLIGMTSELLDTSMGDLELNVGSWVRMLETASGVQATYIGKPNQYAYDLALQSMSLEAGQALMVGDRPNTDILGANRCGLRALLVRTGEFNEAELETSEARPDFMIDAIHQLPGLVAELIANP